MKPYYLTILAASLLSLGAVSYAQQSSSTEPSTTSQAPEPKTVPVLGKVQIDSMTASGENQTTIIDEAGNLKIVEENKAKPADSTSSTTTTTATTNNTTTSSATTPPATATTSPSMANVPSAPGTPAAQPNGAQPSMPAPATMPMPSQSPLPTPTPAPVQPANPAQGSLGVSH